MVTAWGLWGLLLLMCLNGFASTPPSELVLATAGIAASQSNLPLALVILAASFGNLLGTSLLFGLARNYSATDAARHRRRMAMWRRPFSWLHLALPSDQVVARYSDPRRTQSLWWIAYCRCLPVIRSVVSVPAAILRVPWSSFLYLTALGVVAWASAWIFFGYFCGQMAAHYGSRVFLGAFVLAVALIVILRHFHRRHHT